MDTMSKTASRRQFGSNAAKLLAGAAGAVALGSLASSSALAEHSDVEIVERTLIPHGNGAYTLGEISASVVDSASGRTFDPKTVQLHDTGMLVTLPKELGK